MSPELPRILVCVDFSTSSDRAIDEARRLARQMGAQLDLVHIFPLLPTAERPRLPVDTQAMEAARDALHSVEQTSRRDGFVAKAHLGLGSPVLGVLDFIDRLKPELVIVGSHGRGAVMRLLVGSVAESLIRRSPVPVLVVPAAERLAVASETAWSCAACGHIVGKHESTGRCRRCGAEAPQWISAPLTSEPVDAGMASVGEESREEISGSSSAGMFATSPGGVEGYDVNPELRVRY